MIRNYPIARWQWKLSPWRQLAKLLVPFLVKVRYRYFSGLQIEAPVLKHPPTFEDKVLTAIYISVHGADSGGIQNWATMMWPQRKFNIAEVEREASRFLGEVNLALLNSVPPQLKSQLLQDQAEHLSFVE